MTVKERLRPTEPTIFDRSIALVATVILIPGGILLGLFVYPRVLAIGLGILLVGWGLLHLTALLSWYNNPGKPPLEKCAQAIILDRQEKVWEDNYGEEWHGYWVVFQFNIDEGQVALRARVDKSLYERVQTGATLAVRYNATNPHIALLEGEYGFDEDATT